MSHPPRGRVTIEIRLAREVSGYAGVDELQRVGDFRNRLVAYMNRVVAGATGSPWESPREGATRRELAVEQTWLAQEYGRLYAVINRYGSMRMASPALGVTSHDVIQDAIHDIGDVYYDDIARIAIQHLDTVFGRLQADAVRPDHRRAPGAIYRWTSPVYWLEQFARRAVWVWGSSRGRVAAAAGVIALAVVTAFVSGFAQGVAQTVFSRP